MRPNSSAPSRKLSRSCSGSRFCSPKRPRPSFYFLPAMWVQHSTENQRKIRAFYFSGRPRITIHTTLGKAAGSKAEKHYGNSPKPIFRHPDLGRSHHRTSCFPGLSFRAARKTPRYRRGGAGAAAPHAFTPAGRGNCNEFRVTRKEGGRGFRRRSQLAAQDSRCPNSPQPDPARF